MIHFKYILLTKSRKGFSDPLCQQFLALFIRICHNKTVHMDQRHFLRFHVFAIVCEHIQKLNGIHRQVHVNMVRVLETQGQSLFFPVELPHNFSGAHVQTDHFVFDLVKFRVVDKVLVSIRI